MQSVFPSSSPSSSPNNSILSPNTTLESNQIQHDFQTLLELQHAEIQGDNTMEEDNTPPSPPRFCLHCPRWCWPRRTEMPAREFLRLTTWQKFRQYGRIPWKFILNMLLVVATTALVIIMNIALGPYIRSVDANWEYLLSPDAGGKAGESDSYGLELVHYLYTIPSLLGSLSHVTKTYYSLPNVTIDYYEYVHTDDNAIAPLTMEIKRYADGMNIFEMDHDFSDSLITESFPIYNKHELGPFTNYTKVPSNSIINYLHTVDKIKMSFSVQNYAFAFQGRTCFLWDVDVVYDCSVRSRIDLSVYTSPRLCPSEGAISWYNRGLVIEVWLYILITVLACLSQLLLIKAIKKSFHIYTVVRAYNKEKQRRQRAMSQRAMSINNNDILREESSDYVAWESLRWKDKMRFFNVWFFFASIGNICNVVAMSIALNDFVHLNAAGPWRQALSGLGCMFAWLTLLQYYRGSHSYYVLISTLRQGTPRVIRFIIGILPIFFAYALLGVALFSSSSEKFATLDKTCVTLFAVLNGDVINDTFDELYPLHPFISRVYCYTFIFLFIYTILNCMIAIIEDAFFASKTLQTHSATPATNNNGQIPVSAAATSAQPTKPSSAQSSPMLSSSTPPQSFDPLEKLDFSPLTPGRTKSALSMSIAGSSPKRGSSFLGRRSSHDASATNLSSSQPLSVPLLEERTEKTRQSSRVPKEDKQQELEEKGQYRPPNFANHHPPSITISRPSSSSTSASSTELVTLLTEMQQQSTNKFQAQLQSLLQNSSADIRPPHAPEYYPCRFDDCVYCQVRSAYNTTLQQSQQQIDKVMQRLKEKKSRQQN